MGGRLDYIRGGRSGNKIGLGDVSLGDGEMIYDPTYVSGPQCKNLPDVSLYMYIIKDGDRLQAYHSRDFIGYVVLKI